MKAELKAPVSIRVNFIFSAGKPWDTTVEFEKALSDFLDSRNMIGETVNSINSGETIVFISEKPVIAGTEPTENTKDIKKQFKKLVMVRK